MLAVVAYLRSVTPIPHKLEEVHLPHPSAGELRPGRGFTSPMCRATIRSPMAEISRGHWPLHGMPHADDRGSSLIWRGLEQVDVSYLCFLPAS